MTLFPPIEPYDSGWLEVGDGHRLYWEQSGNPEGVPVVLLHGGPGGGVAPVHRCFFDPSICQVTLFDQRGAGRSEPHAETHANTTAHLVEDIELLRRFLGVTRWLVFGGSWGSTLALAYGQAHPAACLGFVLRGVFLFRQAEVDWFLHGMRQFFPEAWQRFADFLPAAERPDLLAGYWRRLADPDPAVHGPAADAWAAYEDSCAHLIPAVSHGGKGRNLALARLEAHYMRNAGFLAEGQLLRELDRISHLPAIIVQGRYDVVCPIASAHQLAQAWPDCELRTALAGHSALEPEVAAGLVRAVADILPRLPR